MTGRGVFVRLRIDPADGDPYEAALDRDSMVIGRSSTSDLSLPDPFLSRYHARLYRENNDLLLEDLGSRNGTFLNGVAIDGPTRVEAGDEIRVSSSIIALCDGAKAEPSRAEIASDLNATIFRPARELLEEESQTHPGLVEDGDALRRYAERLKLFNEIHEALTGELDLQELLELILDRAFDHLGPEQGVVFLTQPDGSYTRAAQRSSSGDHRMPLSRSLIHEVSTKGMAALVLDTATDTRFAGSESIIMSGVRSLIAAPMSDADDPLGMIVLSSRAGAEQFSETDLEFLVSMAAVAALKIKNAALAEEAAERKKLEAQLALARRIQVSLLPKELPKVPELEIFAENLPSLGVSGDYFQVVERDHGAEYILLVADVSGKGVPASLLTASLEALSAAPIEDGLPTDEVCARLSRQLYRRTPPEKYATLFIAAYEVESGRVSYTNAGHNPAIVVRANGDFELLETSGMPVGLMEGGAYERLQFTLDHGDTMVIYTDGITEAESPAEEEYGTDRLRDIVVQHRNDSLEDLAKAIATDLDAFASGVPYHDDRTLMIARRERL